MNMKRFFAKTSKEVLRMVKDELGEDAVIISNKVVNGGNEIMAVAGEDMLIIDREVVRLSAPSMPEKPLPSVSKVAKLMQMLTTKRQPKVQAPPVPDEAPYEVLNDPINETQIIHDSAAVEAHYDLDANEHAYFDQEFDVQDAPYSAPQADEVSAIHEQTQSTEVQESPHAPESQELTHSTAVQSTPLLNDASLQDSHSQIGLILEELKKMRSDIDSQMSEMSFSSHYEKNPSKRFLLTRMVSAGFTPGLSRHFVEKLPNDYSTEQAERWARLILSNNLLVEEDESTVLDKGGVFALVGPTGVGKTTTIAKLAARFVMRHGSSKLAFITTDAYRIGGHEQLRIYGKILGVSVHAVKDEADLALALQELKGKHTILIDTVGVSQRDRMVAEQIAMLSNSGADIKKLLCLNATSTHETLLDVISAYKGDIESGSIDGCIITKVDESSGIANVLDVILQRQLKVHFITNGQRVPEDIIVASKEWIVNHAVSKISAPQGVIALIDEDIPMVVYSQKRLISKALEGADECHN